MKKTVITSFFLLLVPFLVWAAPQIVDIDFEGLTSLSESQAKTYLISREGTPYSTSRVNRDVKKLYQTGYFSNVEVDRLTVPGGVKLVYHVTENQVIGKLTIKGNKKLENEEIEEVFQIHQGEVLDPAKIAATKRELRKLYEEKGYYHVEITSNVVAFDPDKGEVELIFEIHENRPVKIRRIYFLGNKAFSDRKLRSQMKTKEKGFLAFLTSAGKYKDEVLDIDLQRLRFFYLDHGYLNVDIGEPHVTLTRDRRSIYINIPVQEGEQYTVADIDVAGDILTTKEEILSQLKLKKGEVYKKSLEIQDLQTLERHYGDQAYAFANIIPQVDTNPATREARVTYFIQKGPKVKINRIYIRGNKITRDKVIRRELRIYENAFYNQSGLELSKTRLLQLGYFEDVNIATPRAESDNVVNVIIDVKERENTGTFSIGAGFSTLENFIFTATIQKENFFGRGWSGGVSANLSKLRQNFMVQMSDRYFLDTNWQFGFTLIRNRSQLNQFFDENRFGGSVRFGRELFDFFTLSAGYELLDVSVSNFSSQVPAFFQQNASGLTSSLTSSFVYDRRDNRLFTKKGIYTSVAMDYSDEFLGATNNFMRFTVDQRVFIPLLKNVVLKGRGWFGYINSLDSTPVGLFDRFFLGGVNTLRGFDLNSIGPSIDVPQTATGGDTTFTFGGNKSLMFNVELEFPIYAPAGFQGVIFADTGNAYGETENIDLKKFRTDVGFGVRWQSPFGPLRFEWGFPIDKKEGESATVFNFTIGQSF